MKSTANMARYRGIGLIEMLIALSISAVLLLAVGMAFQASFSNYAENQQIVEATQDTRLVLHRLMTQARRSSYLNVSYQGRMIQVETPDDDYQYIYTYVPADCRILLSRMNMTTRATESIGTVDNVTNFVVPSAQWVENPARLTLSMTIRCGSNESTLTGSAVPRSTISF